MATKTFPSAAAMQAALVALSPAQMASVSAGPVEEGGFVLTYPDTIGSLIGAPLPQEMLRQRLVAAASAACASITNQIVPDATHQNAYINAASMVPNAVLPAADPDKTTFADYAAEFGRQPQDFANLVIGLRNASFALSGALTKLEGAAAAAKTSSDLATALDAFQATLTGIEQTIASAGVTIANPSAIEIAGINA